MENLFGHRELIQMQKFIGIQGTWAISNTIIVIYLMDQQNAYQPIINGQYQDSKSGTNYSIQTLVLPNRLDSLRGFEKLSLCVFVTSLTLVCVVLRHTTSYRHPDNYADHVSSDVLYSPNT